LTALKLSEVI